MNSGVQYLMKKNGIEVVFGHANSRRWSIKCHAIRQYGDKRIGTSRTLRRNTSFSQQGPVQEKFLPYRLMEKTSLITGSVLQETRPKRLLIAGAGAIGVELPTSITTWGHRSTWWNFLDRIVPIEDEEIQATGAFIQKSWHQVRTSASVARVEQGSEALKVHLKTARKSEVVEVDQVLSSVGITGNIEDLGLESVGIETERGFIKPTSFHVRGYGAFMRSAT